MMKKSSSAISKLPPELLVLVLLTVYKSHGARCLATALRVSRHWHKIGHVLLWQNLVLADSSIEKFANVLGRTDVGINSAARLDSLTLEIVSPDEGTSSQHPFSKSMHLLASLLPSMINLKSFSVTSQFGGAHSPWLTKQATDDIVIDLVSHLPASIQHLEVDRQIAYFSRVVLQSCLCEVISSRLEGLRSLRLRWPRICSKLFSRPSRTLTHVSLDYTGAGLSPYVRGCASGRSNSRMSWDELKRQSHKLSQAAVQDLLKPLRKDPRRILPNIQHFVIIEPYHFWPLYSNHQWFLLNIHKISVEDSQLLTESYPIWPTGFVDDGLYQFIIRYCMHGKPSQFDSDPTHDCASTDRNGSGRAMCRIFEGLAGWMTHETGARRPLITQRKTALDNDELFLNKTQWQAAYARRRKDDLISEFGLDYIEEPGPTIDLNADIEAAKAFQQQRQVKAAMIGADYIWFLEKRLGHNVLCARRHLGELPLDSDDVFQERFTSVQDLLREVQRDPPWD